MGCTQDQRQPRNSVSFGGFNLQLCLVGLNSNRSAGLHLPLEPAFHWPLRLNGYRVSSLNPGRETLQRMSVRISEVVLGSSIGCHVTCKPGNCNSMFVLASKDAYTTSFGILAPTEPLSAFCRLHGIWLKPKAIRAPFPVWLIPSPYTTAMIAEFEVVVFTSVVVTSSCIDDSKV